MAYCPKCGVEVDNTIRSCPLCSFTIPDVTEAHEDIYPESKYPEAKNIYIDYREGIKNRILFVLVVLMVTSISVLATITLVFDLNKLIVEYIIYSFVAIYLYLFFILGYLNWYVNMTGIALTTLFITYSIDRIGGGSWFISYALPIIVWIYLNGLCFYFIYTHSKRRSRFSYLPTFTLLILTVMCLGIDGIISLNLTGGVKLSWSIIQGISSMAVAVILYAILNHLPGSAQDTLRRKLHL